MIRFLLNHWHCILPVAGICLALSGCSLGNGTRGAADETAPESAAGAREARVIQEGESLVIPISEITEAAGFYPVTVDGTNMEIIAVKAPDGTIRTAFNTCQICYDSGRGYYKQSGGKLVCQNCGNQFAMSRVEVEAGGCNPWPVFEEDKTVTEEAVSISYDFLKASEQVFVNWKGSY